MRQFLRRSVRAAAVFLVGLVAAVPSGVPASAANAPLHVWVYPGNRVAIQPTVYGVNNEWRRITSAEFPAFNTKLQSFGYRLLRFPGGWESEHYDWATNTTPGWSQSPPQPGANAAQAKAAAASIAFVVKTSPYISNPTTANLNMLRNQAGNLVQTHGGTVKHWLIGNEWWLQSAGGGDRQDKIRRYVTVARAIAQEMKAANPAINVYVTGDWTAPWEFTWIRNGFDATSAWRYVDGVDLHIYAGDDGSATDYRNIPRNLEAIKSRTGKTKIFASEWAATKANSVGNKRALRSVNNMVIVMHAMIRAGVTSMSYWPAPDIAPGIGLLNEVSDGVYQDLPHGQAFRWMAKEMMGYSVATTGTPETVASHNVSNKTVTVLIPSKELSNQAITLHFANTDVTQVLSGHVMWMTDPDAIKQAANITGIPVTDFDAANNTVTVTANPGTAGRGSSYELIKLVVRYQ
ncbi:hypothetical protein EDD27_4591 [Nonomuraea polychroma]|uniref:Alpha-L-arabinofuranosidase n=1 Tax=Nonomuraea polychroma TaxID=46176 RepID=A0A438M8N4_9ACTN|nr:hypothetical protein [Nonomuraea polychroma]RVX41975.1 hypothetical protein EDD27_4591 [Nonomuraea polychroma]